MPSALADGAENFKFQNQSKRTHLMTLSKYSPYILPSFQTCPTPYLTPHIYFLREEDLDELELQDLESERLELLLDELAVLREDELLNELL